MYLAKVTSLIDEHLRTKHPVFFGSKASHPFLDLRPFKDIHDPIWGTNRFSWRELVIMDSPIFQRLRRIHQTGLAYYVYPSARHSRFEHSLGVVTVATRVFDSVAQRFTGILEEISGSLAPKEKFEDVVSRWRQELRLAALLHDTGHSLLSHASERVYGELQLLKNAAVELSEVAAAKKKAGEVLSYCLARTPALAELLARAKGKLMKGGLDGEFSGDVDIENVSLLILGRSRHPWQHFMGDIISSGFDADKLDYLLRDAISAGLPLRYDLERYLSTVSLPKLKLYDDPTGKLEKLYNRAEPRPAKHAPSQNEKQQPYFYSYRLRLPKRSMNTIEQITICKLMLTSYIYQHQKVRAAEGMFERLLLRVLREWQYPEKSDSTTTKGKVRKKSGKTDEEIVPLFLDLDDTSLHGDKFLGSESAEISETSYRLVNRLLPRVVYEISPTTEEPHDTYLTDFFSKLEDDDAKTEVLDKLDAAVGTELIRRRSDLKAEPDVKSACRRAGVWFDVPWVPTFEGMDELIVESDGGYPVKIGEMFPINKWLEAYQKYRLTLRVFSYSEYWSDVAAAAESALKKVTGIKDHEFYRRCLRNRDSK